ncbi:energy-coupling factor transporter transmembrane component T family protein [Treponema denticola]|uniref:energy-coupling factor transporter transmembrane component T family protein n=1 Tax=Treponema denticola TaxID=158 RepID=UPI0021049148|nr:energy-coupling factor transporter transmembrane component T [Treponema denticola]UTY24190.1 energy-coupling factor transporter transmembrane protein EcfT [Treponema denticola]
MKPARNTQGWSMNPITLFILILLTSFLVFLVNQTMYYVLLGMSFLFLFLFSYTEGVKRALAYIGLFLLIKLLAYIDLGMTTGALIGLIALFLRLYPIFNIGKILILTSPLKIMSALRAVKAPQSLSIGLVTALRFLDEMTARLNEIKNGMKVRGLRLSLLHPIRSFELYLIPLIYKCLHVSETLTSSIIAKGIEYEGKKTSYRPVHFGWYDTVGLLAAVFLLWISVWA